MEQFLVFSPNTIESIENLHIKVNSDISGSRAQDCLTTRNGWFDPHLRKFANKKFLQVQQD